ncbi:hypothetical protein VC83_01578 [Pseudogymnoascus destructans]|uniref:Uncharacterized protein n=1 Tax=Pseudogymnoascus destructans TaxID=655981 RepID=A0A177AI24_9PEZI|nr:uncharacterized protein VC83_01578 [Pseudogymnoascus destructans]OAF61719.2 hypothetical protein VC83_01578 [Pseudogymnoascus destructans]
MPQASVVEWIAGATLPRQRRRRSLESPQSNTVQHHSMGARNNSGCCPTSCSCSGCDDRSEASTDSPSKRVRFKQPKGILKHSRKVDAEEHICCSACTPSAHCNERHRVGKNGKVYGSSKKCAPKGGKKEVDNWGESKSTSNSPKGMKDTSNNNYSVYQTQTTPSPPQTPEQRRTLQNLSSFITKNMSRLILPSRAEVIIREDVLENASDPRPNAFFDARTGMLRVYHGPMYGNPGASLVPLQAQHVPIGTPAPPPSAWANPWAGMIGGMSGRWPFNVNQRGGGGDQGMQNSGNSENNYNSSGNRSNRQSNNSRGGSKPMPGSFSNDGDQNGNSGWNTADNNANKNSNDDGWGTGNNDANNNSPDNGGQGDTWGTDNNNSSGNDNWGSNQNKSNPSSGNDNWGSNPNNNNASPGDDNWGTNNNNTSSGDDNWGTGPDNSNHNNNGSSSNSRWPGYKDRPNQNGTSQRIFPDATGTEFSAGSWGEPAKQESWGDKTAAQSTKNNSNDTSGW